VEQQGQGIDAYVRPCAWASGRSLELSRFGACAILTFMGKADIIDALPQLSLADRSEILSRLLQLEAAEPGQKPSAEEKALLDSELESYRSDPESRTPWKDAEARLRRPQ